MLMLYATESAIDSTTQHCDCISNVVGNGSYNLIRTVGSVGVVVTSSKMLLAIIRLLLPKSR